MNKVIVFNLVYFILWLLNYFLSGKKKVSGIIALCTWGFLYVLFASNLAIEGDAYKYKMDYELGIFGSGWAEKGYEVLKWICRFCGLKSYNHFLVAIFAIGSFLIFWGVTKINGDLNIVFFSTMPFLFPALAAAIRFFIAFSIFVFCLAYLIKGEKIKYLIGILVAIAFHRSALFFLLFLLCEAVDVHRIDDGIKRHVVKMIGLISGVCTIYTLFFRQLPFIGIIKWFFLRYIPEGAAGATKVEVYFSSTTRFGFLILVVLYITNFWLSKCLLRVSNAEQYEERDKKLAMIGYSINVIMAITLPFSIINLVFFRLYGVQTIINCIIYSRVNGIRSFSKLGKLNKTELLFIVSVLAWIIPALLKINSISVNELILASGFVR